MMRSGDAAGLLKQVPMISEEDYLPIRLSTVAHFAIESAILHPEERDTYLAIAKAVLERMLSLAGWEDTDV